MDQSCRRPVLLRGCRSRNRSRTHRGARPGGHRLCWGGDTSSREAQGTRVLPSRAAGDTEAQGPAGPAWRWKRLGAGTGLRRRRSVWPGWGRGRPAQTDPWKGRRRALVCAWFEHSSSAGPRGPRSQEAGRRPERLVVPRTRPLVRQGTTQERPRLPGGSSRRCYKPGHGCRRANPTEFILVSSYFIPSPPPPQAHTHLHWACEGQRGAEKKLELEARDRPPRSHPSSAALAMHPWPRRRACEPQLAAARRSPSSGRRVPVSVAPGTAPSDTAEPQNDPG